MLVALDVIFAKARLSYSHEGHGAPRSILEGKVVLNRARHPLIDKKRCGAHFRAAGR